MTVDAAEASVKDQEPGTPNESEDLPPVEKTADVPTASGDSPARTALLRRAWFWLALLVVVLLAVSVVSVLGWRRATDRADGLQRSADLSTSALQAARKYTVDLTTYSYKQLDKQQATLNAESTAKFRKTFANSSKTLAKLFTSVQATATGKVVDAAVKAVSRTNAVVLVFVDQVAKSTQLKQPQTQSSRLRMNLVRKGSTWLLDSVDLV